MDKKYFVISDVHSFYTPMVDALTNSGFELNNPNHILIVCGDIFDRGQETLEVYSFLKDLPKDRCILIKGNHEELYFKLLNKNYPEEHDFSNGTVSTFCQIAGYSLDVVYDLRYGYYIHYGTYFDQEGVDPDCQVIWDAIKRKVKNSEITKWLKSKQWVNYYELDKYIFVHSFIPLNFKPERLISQDYATYYGMTQYFTFMENWREADNDQWASAAWGCPFVFFDEGLFDPEKEKGKILVCGHYRCSEFNKHYLDKESFESYIGENLIAIDATTVLSGKVNVLKI